MTWHQKRFEPSQGKVAVACKECLRPMWLPPSKVDEYQRCSPACNAARKERERAERRRQCEVCGNDFFPRTGQLKIGQGRFCSPACRGAKIDHLQTAEVKQKAIDRLNEVRRAGGVQYYRGESHPSWKGGPKEAARRRVESGKAAETNRKWRKQNPDKLREFTLRRRALRGKGAKLPRGTVANIYSMQRERCALCAVKLNRKYHLDHIVAISRGGKHIPSNVQLLCMTCNVRKSAKDQIDYMQSLGRLL